ncbi:hypothetical protein FB451DRAFT_1402392 [Mycena latifolia]|nr:hypothetical protein FB451DRAFT_1402392 [Mycena latifolia]
MESTFPLELEREIFETTALMHPGQIPTLLRVARRVLLWIEPLLYRVISARDAPPYSAQALALLRATKSKPPKFFQDAVRHLLVGFHKPWSREEAVEVLTLCTGVVNLAFFGQLASPAILPILATMRLLRLSASLVQLLGGSAAIDPTHALFSSLTHLHVFDRPENLTRILAHPALPALTHLCLNNELPWGVITTLLADRPRLDILLNLWDRAEVMVAYEHA